MSVIFETPADLKEFLGKEIGVSEWLTITQERILQFAEATEDRQWIHLDRERAERESPYGTTIAHGFLTLSLLSHFVKQAIQINSGIAMTVNYGLNKVRFPSAVHAGASVRARIDPVFRRKVSGRARSWGRLPSQARHARSDRQHISRISTRQGQIL